MKTATADQPRPNKNMTLDDVLKWIIENSDDQEAMDKINRLTYIYTPHYKPRRER